MGWTSYHAENYKNGKVDRKAECDKLFNCNMVKNRGYYTVLKSSMVGSTYYAAVKKVEYATETQPEKTKIFAVIVLTSVKHDDYFNFSYKDMDETCGPYNYDCPKAILDLLSETDNEYANEWRSKCRENHAKKKDPNSLKNLPLGSVIRFITPYNLSGGIKAGEEIKLTKIDWGRKTPYWYDGQFRYSPKLIGDNYTIVSRG